MAATCFQRNVLEHPATEDIVRMIVRVDEAGDDQLVGAVDDPYAGRTTCRPVEPGGRDRDDATIMNVNVLAFGCCAGARHDRRPRDQEVLAPLGHPMTILSDMALRTLAAAPASNTIRHGRAPAIFRARSSIFSASPNREER
jgi:hypothetical protein